MSLYNKKQTYEILEQFFAKTIVDSIQSYLCFLIKIKMPLSINGAMINICEMLDEKNPINMMYDGDFIVLDMNENYLPFYLKYIGENQQVSINRNIHGEKFKILKDILGYHFNINPQDFNIDQIKISLNGLVKYNILIDIPPINKIPIDKIKMNNFLNCSDFVMVDVSSEEKRKYVRCEKIEKSVCSIEISTIMNFLFTYSRSDTQIFITGRIINR